MIHLTGQSYNAREIIQNIFSPLVGVVTSQMADEICHKNNLSFVEMLQPFAKLPNDAQFRDSTGTSVSIKGLRLNICDINWRPPQTILARKMMNEAVTNGVSDKMKFITIGGNIELEVPTAEPWFENWRETFLTVQFPADHEFTRHFLSCLIVLSSGDPNVVETAQKLTHCVQIMQNVTPQKLPKWFQPNDVLNSYIVLHEGSSGDLSKAQQSYELLKATFGDNRCFLIQINSLAAGVSGDIPDYWASYIRRPPKADLQTDQSSAPKTPQDSVSVISMPSMQLTNTDGSDNEAFLHPLSPIQEQATEAIHSKFSVSSESIISQTINPNVWAGETDTDASHGSYLNSMDVENLRHFVQDYTVRALIPYVERLVVVLNDAVTTKKGVSKSLLSATKRWFVTSKPGAGASNQNAVIYTNESVELQTRKLGDLYFMFGHYNLAFQAYHQAKRDFNADSAWQYYAGALEMAAVSAFMLGTANRKTYDYMEDAIVCYLSVCKLQQFATRATLLSIECLKTARLYGEAAKQLIRMTSEESDLRSALLLEQAAYCFLASQPALHRKYAFHIVLSGNRYSRAGQRKHAFRCYKQAYQVFQERGWSLAEDHIQYTIGKQAYTLKKLDEASRSFAHLLRPTSLQNTQQQATFLKEYIQTQKELLQKSPELGLLEIALPKVEQTSIRVLVTAQPPIANPLYVAATNITIQSNLSDESTWQKIEEMIATTASNKPIVFKPTKTLFTHENPSVDHPLAVHGEPIEVAVTISNAIKTSVTLADIDILWKLTLENEETLSNLSLYVEGGDKDKTAINAAIKTACSQEIVLEEQEQKVLYFKMTPKLTGQLNIIGIVGRVSATNEPNSLLGCLHFETQQIKGIGKQSNATLFDNKLAVKILPPAPSLNVSFSTIPSDILVGETIPVTISLRNTGIMPIDDVFVGCECPRWITLLDKEADVPLSILRDFKDLTNETLSKDKEIRKQHVFRILKQSDGQSLKAQEATMIPMWIQAPYQKGEFTLRLIFYYTMPPNYPGIKYRLVRHEWKFNVHECLQTEVNCVVSNLMTSELGLDMEFKNLNQTHHPLMTELYINSIQLFCPQYKLNNKNLYFMNQMEISSGQLGDKCLKAAKSASIQCRLERCQVFSPSTATTTEFVKQRLSSVLIKEASIKENHIPSFDKLYSFLMKHETKFLNPFNSNINTEEFNAILSTCDPHMTVSINWTAVVVDCNSSQRHAHGQHFVQLRNLYEQVSCPETADYRMKTYLGDTSAYKKIHEFEEFPVDSVNDDDEDQWEFNNNFVGKRCLLQDETYITSAIVKA